VKKGGNLLEKDRGGRNTGGDKEQRKEQKRGEDWFESTKMA